jgi:CheY-like chemotaxis protein/nitrogen-specific signal transduction histidine kinase
VAARAQIEEQTRAAEDARLRAEDAARAKDEFLAMLGHELRNPLAPILTALQLMRLRGNNIFEKERAVIDRQVKHVVRLVDDLLEVSRITRAKISLDRAPVDVAEVIATAVELSSPLLERRMHHVSIDVEPDLVVEGDATRLAQVFTNLLTNAAKYTQSGGSISISATRRAKAVRVAVRDTGMGIRPELLPVVFDLFVQGRQAVDRSEGGLGLGLAIVKSLVALHGGTVEARSDGLGRGSEFVVDLPASSASAEIRRPAIESSERAVEPSGRRILVVDDNEDAASMLAEALHERGHSVKVAHDGPQALELLQTFAPEIAFLDIGLPVMDGYELARRIRDQRRLAGVRLVSITGYGQPSDRARATEAGFDIHLVKPVDLTLVEKVISGGDAN